MTDEYNLQRFIDVQASNYDAALAILRGGRMCTQHMEYVFPRLDGCYHTAKTQPYALSSVDEARAYLAHTLLGGRLRESLRALEWLVDDTAVDVFGEQDARNLHSSLTLFGLSSNETLLRDMLAVWFGCRTDEPTIERMDLVP